MPGDPVADVAAGVAQARAARSLTLQVQPDPLGVRAALARVTDGLADVVQDSDGLDRLQIVLAEVLNNVVEHAIVDHPDPRIEVRLTGDPKGIACTVLDDGKPMPDGVLPAGDDTWDTVDVTALPEGGFGWFLIRQQVDALSYCRDADVNRVAFRLSWDGAAPHP